MTEEILFQINKRCPVVDSLHSQIDGGINTVAMFLVLPTTESDPSDQQGSDHITQPKLNNHSGLSYFIQILYILFKSLF